MRRYGGLRKATILFREDGMLDVIRERETNGESFRGCANLDEAFAVIRAHGATELSGTDPQETTTMMNERTVPCASNIQELTK